MNKNYRRFIKYTLLICNLLFIFGCNRGNLLPNFNKEYNNDCSFVLDTSFNYGQGPGYKFDKGWGFYINSSTFDYFACKKHYADIAIQQNGKIIFTGEFSSFNNEQCEDIARLNANGSYDTSFKATSAFDETITTICLQDNGKLLVGGNFDSCFGEPVHKLVRLNEDGNLDKDFKCNLKIHTVNQIKSTSHEKTVVNLEVFTDSLNNTAEKIFCLYPDGRVDSNFVFPKLSSCDILGFDVQPNEKVLCLIKDKDCKKQLIRFNTNGTIDNTFKPELKFDNSNENNYDEGGIDASFAVQKDGKIIIGNTINNVSKVIRLEPNGKLDPTFFASSLVRSKQKLGAESEEPFAIINKIIVQENGTIVISSSFFEHYVLSGTGQLLHDLSKKPIYGLIPYNDSLFITFNTGFQFYSPSRFYFNGEPDNSFIQNHNVGANGRITTIFSLSNGKFGINSIGFGRTYNNTKSSPVLLAKNGSIDSSNESKNIIKLFSKTGNNYYLNDVKFLDFKNKNFLFLTNNSLALYNYDGSVSVGFKPIVLRNNPDIIQNSLISLKSDSKSRILVAGRFETANGIKLPKLFRCLKDGSVDKYFNPVVDNYGLENFAIQPDNKVLIISSSGEVTRLLENGRPDTSFKSSFLTFPNGCFAIKFVEFAQANFLENGNILITGNIRRFNGSSCNNMVCLNPDGSLNKQFKSDAGPNSAIYCTSILPDGRIILGGKFDTYAGKIAEGIAVINSRGKLTSSMKAGEGFNGSVHTVYIQKNGSLIVGGDFSTFNHRSTPNICRLLLQ